MDTCIHNNIYPLSIRSHDVRKYTKRNTPCIVFYDWPNDLKNASLVNRVRHVSYLFPYILCYKVGWVSYKQIYKTTILDEFNEVSFWNNNKKVIFLPNPNEEQLVLLFSIISQKLFYLKREEYISILENDRLYKMRKLNEYYNRKLKKSSNFHVNQFKTHRSLNQTNLRKYSVENDIISNISLISEFYTRKNTLHDKSNKANSTLNKEDLILNIEENSNKDFKIKYKKIAEINKENFPFIGSLFTFKDIKTSKTLSSNQKSKIFVNLNNNVFKNPEKNKKEYLKRINVDASKNKTKYFQILKYNKNK